MLHVRSLGHRLSLRRNVWLATALLAVATAQAQQPVGGAAAAPSRELLNSERIAQRFGSYGIDVLGADGRVRVSNLYSGTGRTRTKDLPHIRRREVSRQRRSALAAEHDEIVHGGSIGAVFAAHGWKVGKTNLRFLEVDATPRVAELMHVAPALAWRRTPTCST